MIKSSYFPELGELKAEKEKKKAGLRRMTPGILYQECHGLEGQVEPSSDSSTLTDYRAWTPCPRAWKSKDPRVWFPDTPCFSDTQIAPLAITWEVAKLLMSGLIPRNFNVQLDWGVACTSWVSPKGPSVN